MSATGTAGPVALATQPFGAEVRGIDLGAPLTAPTRRAVQALLVRHQVLFWRDQDITVEQQLEVAEAFGPHLRFASVVDTAAGTSGVHEVRGSTVGWHIDASSMLEPPVATVLRAVDVPPEGGDTVWASGIAALAALPDSLVEQLEGCHATHATGRAGPLVAHPLVQTHPESGKRYLYLNFAPWADAVVIGMSRQESTALVDRLRSSYLHPDNQLRFHWRPGSVAMWDNRVVQHTGTSDYSDHPRLMTRVCIARFHELDPG